MGNDVFANGREISCKKADGKSICAFPDVCMTPPENPATPPGVPVPYPNTGMASDTTGGSKNIKISGQEVILKNKSSFKKSTGDEAGSAAKKGVVTGTNRGKVFFKAWSMDVKFEGENIVRHLDLTTHNHMSDPPNSPPWPYLDSMAIGTENPCSEEIQKEEKACGHLYVRNSKGRILKGKSRDNICADNDDAKACRKAQKCRLQPQDSGMCCPGQQAHHIIEAHGFIEEGTRDNFEGKALKRFKGPPAYRPGDAPCVCAEGDRWSKEHGAFHALVGQKENAAIRKAKGSKKNEAWNYRRAKNAGINAHQKVFADSGCSKKCLEAQLDHYHSAVGASDNAPLRTETAGLKDWMKKKVSQIISEMKRQLGQSSAGKSAF